MRVCVCVRDGSGMFVGRDWTSDARPSYFNLPNLELREECSSMHGLEQLQADAMREQQSKRMQSGSSSWIGHNRGSGAAVETGAIGEQELKQTQSGSSSWYGRNWGAVEVDAIGCSSWNGRKAVDAIGEQQLKRTQSGSSSSVHAQRAVRRRLLT